MAVTSTFKYLYYNSAFLRHIGLKFGVVNTENNSHHILNVKKTKCQDGRYS